MNRIITTERVYSLGNYQTLRLTDSINDIPDELMLDQGFVDSMRKLQFVSLELMYRRYMNLAEKLLQINAEEAINSLMTTRENILEKISETIKEDK